MVSFMSDTNLEGFNLPFSSVLALATISLGLEV
jgi:hypothetical protein